MLTRDGKLFISNASQLTPNDRTAIQQHKPELIKIATYWPEEKPTTLAMFLGHSQQERQIDWTPQEPPDLTGIDNIVLNFATDGVDWAGGSRPIGVTVSTMDGGLTRFLPFKFQGGNLDEAVVKRWAQEQLRGKHITNANTRFDVHMAREWGVDLEAQGCTVSDVMHYAALLDDHRRQFKLDKLIADYLPDERAVDRVDEARHVDYEASEVSEREIYTAQATARLRNVMWPLLDKEELQSVRQIEDDVIYPVVEMEKNGVKLDLELLERYSAECKAAHDKLMMEIADEAGFGFEHSASGWKRLFERVGLPPSDSYAEDIVSVIDHPLVKKGYLASQYASLHSKTFGPYKQHVGSDGIFRFEINQLKSEKGGTVSGRFSIGYVQQVPNKDNHAAVFGEALNPRKLYIAAEGDVLEADANQIEYRIFAHLANNAKVIKAYEEDPRLSFHKMTWEMFKVHKSDMLYSNQKRFNFAVQYGAKVIKLAIMMGYITEAEGAEIRAAKRWRDPRLTSVQAIVDIYKQVMPEGEALLDHAAHLAKPACDKYCKMNDIYHRTSEHRGYIKTLAGRRSRFEEHDKTYIALNRAIQGGASDIMKRKLYELHRARKHTGLLLRLSVHDSVLGDARLPDTKQRVAEILNEQSFPLKVLILWECGVGKNWAECK